MAIGNRFQLIDRQTLLGQACYNIYFYRQIAEGVYTARDLIESYLTTILPLLLPIQTNQLTHDLIIALNIDDEADFSTQGLTADNVGLNSGGSLPPYAAWAFIYNRSTRAVRNGQKRIGGVPEAMQDNGVVTSGDRPTVLAVAEGLEANLQVMTTDVFEPRIFHRATGTPTPPLGDGTDYAITGVAYTRISTQNTRKFGRGA